MEKLYPIKAEILNTTDTEFIYELTFRIQIFDNIELILSKGTLPITDLEFFKDMFRDLF